MRARFVHCRDALIQILVSLDRDKNNSIGITKALVASEKRLTVRLVVVFFFFFLSRAGVKGNQETDSCINSREDTVVSFRAY